MRPSATMISRRAILSRAATTSRLSAATDLASAAVVHVSAPALRAFLRYTRRLALVINAVGSAQTRGAGHIAVTAVGDAPAEPRVCRRIITARTLRRVAGPRYAHVDLDGESLLMCIAVAFGSERDRRLPGRRRPIGQELEPDASSR